MPRRSDIATCLALVAGASASLQCSRVETTQVLLDVGHHRVQLVIPAGWEHLDHGRQHLFRSGEWQLSLMDMGVATHEGLVNELRAAESLWREGRHADATARIHDLRGPMLRNAPHGRIGEFWKPWTDVTYHPEAGDSLAIGAAIEDLIEGTKIFEAVTSERLIEYVLSSVMDTSRYEIARQSERTIHGSDWIDIETWDRVSHLARSRLAFTENGGYLLVLGIERGPIEQTVVVFEALLASIQVSLEGEGPR